MEKSTAKKPTYREMFYFLIYTCDRPNLNETYLKKGNLNVTHVETLKHKVGCFTGWKHTQTAIVPLLCYPTVTSPKTASFTHASHRNQTDPMLPMFLGLLPGHSCMSPYLSPPRISRKNYGHTRKTNVSSLVANENSLTGCFVPGFEKLFFLKCHQPNLVK